MCVNACVSVFTREKVKRRESWRERGREEERREEGGWWREEGGGRREEGGGRREEGGGRREEGGGRREGGGGRREEGGQREREGGGRRTTEILCYPFILKFAPCANRAGSCGVFRIRVMLTVVSGVMSTVFFRSNKTLSPSDCWMA